MEIKIVLKEHDLKKAAREYVTKYFPNYKVHEAQVKHGSEIEVILEEKERPDPY